MRTHRTRRRCHGFHKSACDRSAPCRHRKSPISHRRRCRPRADPPPATARARAVQPSGSSLAPWIASGLRSGRAKTTPAGIVVVAGYQRCRSESPRRRNAPDRSMTRRPRLTSAVPTSAAAASGSARKTISALSARRSTSSGVTEPSQIRLSAGSARGALVAPEDLAARSPTAGCRASTRRSSWPA